MSVTTTMVNATIGWINTAREPLRNAMSMLDEDPLDENSGLLAAAWECLEDADTYLAAFMNKERGIAKPDA